MLLAPLLAQAAIGRVLSIPKRAHGIADGRPGNPVHVERQRREDVRSNSVRRNLIEINIR
jgi:hypothetical protein